MLFSQDASNDKPPTETETATESYTPKTVPAEGISKPKFDVGPVEDVEEKEDVQPPSPEARQGGANVHALAAAVHRIESTSQL